MELLRTEKRYEHARHVLAVRARGAELGFSLDTIARFSGKTSRAVAAATETLKAERCSATATLPLKPEVVDAFVAQVVITTRLVRRCGLRRCARQADASFARCHARRDWPARWS